MELFKRFNETIFLKEDSNLEKQIKETETNLQHKAKEISESRKNFAQVLSVLIQEKLEKLELPKARFEISVKPKELSEPPSSLTVPFSPVK